MNVTQENISCIAGSAVRVSKRRCSKLDFVMGYRIEQIQYKVLFESLRKGNRNLRNAKNSIWTILLHYVLLNGVLDFVMAEIAVKIAKVLTDRPTTIN